MRFLFLPYQLAVISPHAVRYALCSFYNTHSCVVRKKLLDRYIVQESGVIWNIVLSIFVIRIAIQFNERRKKRRDLALSYLKLGLLLG